MNELPSAAAEPFFLNHDDQRLFAMLHRPNSEVLPKVGVVICTALADEHIASYRIVYRFAVDLAAAGIAVLRFDPPGQGDSEGEMANSTPGQMAVIAKSGADVLRKQVGANRVGFMGIRLGCAAAIAAAESSPDSFCVAWSPVLSPDRYYRDLLRRQILSDVMYGEERRSTKAMLDELQNSSAVADAEFDIGGYSLTGSFYKAYLEFDVLDRLSNAHVPGLVIHDEKLSAAEQSATKVGAWYHEPNVQVFWQFPREGSVPAAPSRWMDLTRTWLLKRSEFANEY